MYNEDQKMRYIQKKNSEVVINEYTLSSLFNKVSIFEETFQKDVCNFSKYEIIEMYKMINSNSFSSLQMTNSMLSMYTQWCMEQGLVTDGQNHFLEISSESIRQCLNKFVIDNKIVSREQVLEWANMLDNNPRDKFMLIALFEYGKMNNFVDISYATMDSINLDNNTMKLYSGRIVHVSNELIAAAEDANDEKKYYGPTGKPMGNLIDNGTIIKEYRNAKAVDDFYSGRRIYNNFIRCFTTLGINKYIIPNDISDSGKIHMIKIRSNELGITNREYILKYSKEILNQYGGSFNTLKTSFVSKYGDLL